MMDNAHNRSDVAYVIGTAGMACCRDVHQAFDYGTAFYRSALESFLEVFVADGGTDDAFLCETFAWIDNYQSECRHQIDEGSLNALCGLVAFCAVIVRYGPHVAKAMAYGHPDVMIRLIKSDTSFELVRVDIAESMRPIGGAKQRRWYETICLYVVCVFLFTMIAVQFIEVGP